MASLTCDIGIAQASEVCDCISRSWRHLVMVSVLYIATSLLQALSIAHNLTYLEQRLDGDHLQVGHSPGCFAWRETQNLKHAPQPRELLRSRSITK
jgi:hypothetical protein